MREATPLQVSVQPPRDYPNREALRGRVWRDGWALYSRELSVFSACGALYGLLLNELMWLTWGALVLMSATLIGAVGSVWVNLRRARLVREAPVTEGTLISKRRRLFWHELLRGKAHRSFTLTFSYQVPGEVSPREGQVTLCLCAYEHLKRDEALKVIYDPTAPKRALPLRLALMRIPH